MGIFVPFGLCWRRYKISNTVSVRQAPMALPEITALQALPALLPAQKWRQTMVMLMESSCSPISTAARVPTRFCPVKNPVIRAHRQLTGRKQEKSRRQSVTAGFPIQRSAIWGASAYRSPPMPRLHPRLYTMHPESTDRSPWGLRRPSSSAVKYMAAVRMPPIPAIRARLPTDMVSCKSPMPSGPIFRDR